MEEEKKLPKNIRQMAEKEERVRECIWKTMHIHLFVN